MNLPVRLLPTWKRLRLPFGCWIVADPRLIGCATSTHSAWLDRQFVSSVHPQSLICLAALALELIPKLRRRQIEELGS
jgi:hypothetical protein